MSFGSVLGAIISQRNNKRPRADRSGKGLATSDENSQGVRSHRKPSKEEIQQIKRRILSENRKRQRKIMIITAAFLIVFAILFGMFMF